MNYDRLNIFQPYLPVLVEEGFLCHTCHRILPIEQWVRKSMGQCEECWESNPRAVPVHSDWDEIRRVAEEIEAENKDE